MKIYIVTWCEPNSENFPFENSKAYIEIEDARKEADDLSNLGYESCFYPVEVVR